MNPYQIFVDQSQPNYTNDKFIDELIKNANEAPADEIESEIENEIEIETEKEDSIDEAIEIESESKQSSPTIKSENEGAIYRSGTPYQKRESLSDHESNRTTSEKSAGDGSKTKSIGSEAGGKANTASFDSGGSKKDHGFENFAYNPG